MIINNEKVIEEFSKLLSEQLTDEDVDKLNKNIYEALTDMEK